MASKFVRLEFVQGSSNKFWEGEVRDSIFTARWGRIGTAGQTKTSEFNSNAAAIKHYNTKMDEKIRKGYTIIDSALSRKKVVPTKEDVSAEGDVLAAEALKLFLGNQNKAVTQALKKIVEQTVDKKSTFGQTKTQNMSNNKKKRRRLNL